MNGIIMILLFTLLLLFLADFVVLRKLWRGGWRSRRITLSAREKVQTP